MHGRPVEPQHHRVEVRQGSASAAEQDLNRRRESGWTALGGVVGPATFVAAWVIGGAVQDGYSPIDEPISRLAAVGASARVLMNVGLVALGVGLLLFAAALRSRVRGRAWLAAAVSGIATLGIAAVPLGRTDAGDGLHGALAFTGYMSLIAIPLIAARRFGRRGLKQLSLVVAVLAGACLFGAVSSTVAVGAFQRAGLLLLHSWVAAVAVCMVRTSYQ